MAKATPKDTQPFYIWSMRANSVPLGDQVESTAGDAFYLAFDRLTRRLAGPVATLLTIGVRTITDPAPTCGKDRIAARLAR